MQRTLGELWRNKDAAGPFDHPWRERYTVLTVLDGFEKSMFDTYAKAEAPGAEIVGEYPTRDDALADARVNCPADELSDPAYSVGARYLSAAVEAAPPTTHGMPNSIWPSTPAATQPKASAVWPACPHQL